jgi:protein-S-isoprenylcysteine O-methyltransferase Ste14
MSKPAQTLESANHFAIGSDTAWRVREIAANVLLSLFYLSFAVAFARDLSETFRLSSLLLLMKVSTDVVFYLLRRLPREVSHSSYDWTIAILGTYAVALFRPVAESSDQLVGQLLQCTGLALQTAAMLSLNRSIGIVPANRGIKTGGLYRFVRHPLYLSYVVAFGGYTLNQPGTHNVAVYLLAVALWVLRLLAEERLLMQDPEYRAFAASTRWRLIPYVY